MAMFHYISDQFLFFFHAGEKILRPRSPSGDDLYRLRKRNIQRMDTIRCKDVNRPSQRRRYGRDENGEAMVFQLFNNEGWDKGIFNLSQCGLPCFVFSLPS